MYFNSLASSLARATAIVACLTAFGAAHAQPARSAGPVITETSPNSDTIGERANWSLEEQRKKNSSAPVPSAAPIGVIPANTIRAGAAPEFAVTGIRGFSGTLEASFLINGKRAAGSARYPTLVDNWKVIEITSAGAVIERNKEKKQLPFSGSSPYQEKTATAVDQPAANNIMPLRNPVPSMGLGLPPGSPMSFPTPAGIGPVPFPGGETAPALR